MGNQEGKSLFKSSNFAKQTLVQQDEHVEFAVSHMKGTRVAYVGWRLYMEDASIHISNFPSKNHYLFGVFDGHGGN